MTQFLSLRQAAKASGLSMHSVLKAAAAGQVRTEMRPGYAIRFDRDDLVRFAAEMKRIRA